MADDAGLFLGSGGAVTQVARKGHASPDGNGHFASFGQLAMNTGGAALFSAQLSGTNGAGADDLAYFLAVDGGITVAVREGQPAPDGNGTISTVGIPRFNDAGIFAFKSELADSAGGAADQDAILRGSGRALVQIVRGGQALPGGNGSFLDLDDPQGITASGAMVFRANLTGTSGGNADNSAIFLSDGEEMIQVVRKGQILGGRTLTAVAIPRLNESGQVAFTGQFSGGSQSGLFLHTPGLRYRRTAGGTWDTTDNWTLGLKPAAVHAVAIDPATGVTVVGPAGATSVKTLTVGATTSGVAELRLQAAGPLSASGGITISPRGRISGSGTLGGPLTLVPGGELSAYNGDALTVSGPVATSAGEINAFGGTLRFLQAVSSSGEIQALDGTLDFSGGLTHGGTMNLLEAVVEGDVAATPGSMVNVIFGATFNGLFSGAASFPETGAVTFNGGFSPGDGAKLAVFPGALTFGSGNTLFMEIGGTARGVDHDAIDAGGLLALGGHLNLVLTGGFVPAVGQSFDLFDAATLTGGFGSLTLPALPAGLAWNTTMLATSGVIAVEQQTNTSIWTGGIGNWSDPSKWLPDAFAPDNGNGGYLFNAQLGSGTITLDKDIALERFTQAGGIVSAPAAAPATLALNVLFTWAGGVIGGTVTALIDAGASLTLSGPEMKQVGGGANNGSTLINRGNTTLSGGNFHINPSGGANPGSRVINEGTFEFSDEADLTFVTYGGSMPDFTNAAGGLVRKSGASTTSSINVPFFNAGTVNVLGGTLHINQTFTQSAGTFALVGGSVTNSVPLQIQGGSASGSGSISGPLQVAGGTLAPGLPVGLLTIGGDLTLDAASRVAIEIGGTAPGTGYDRIEEAGGNPLTLAGTLQVSIIGGFQGTILATDTFTILASNQPLSGSFANVANGARLATSGGHGSFRVSYGTSSSFDAGSVVLDGFLPSAAGTYADWIGGFTGLGGMTGIDDDPDGDGLRNGVEHYLGTDPSRGNAGPGEVSATSSTLRFRHTRTNSPASDLAATIEWSGDLVNWFASGESDGQGLAATVSESVVTDRQAPDQDLVEVTITVTSGVAPRLFARIRVLQGP